jgi:phenylpyruvate tautomerase PptA (4-oxalocrotonate tautomerase family)
MPFYEVHHSHPLTNEQQQEIASAITNLHATTFTTPSLFVHVHFTKSDESGGAVHFMAGTRRSAQTNRIIGTVRTSAKRTKADFDRLAQRIESAWYSALSVNFDETTQQLSPSDEGKRLALVAFTPLLHVREWGLGAPDVGKEGEWMKELLPYMQRIAETGNKDIADMIKEFEEREDLKKLLE